MVGCEIGGAYKNVVALSVGMAVGLGFGDNTTASVITRGLAELTRLALALGARRATLMGLAGLGYLLLTATSLTSQPPGPATVTRARSATWLAPKWSATSARERPSQARAASWLPTR